MCVGTSVKRRELVEWSRSVAVSVAATVALADFELLSETDRERPWRNVKEEEDGEVALGEEGEVLELWLLWSLDRRWFWV